MLQIDPENLFYVLLSCNTLVASADEVVFFKLISFVHITHYVFAKFSDLSVVGTRYLREALFM